MKCILETLQSLLQLDFSTSKLDKYAWYYIFVGAPEAGFGTTSHDLHLLTELQ